MRQPTALLPAALLLTSQLVTSPLGAAQPVHLGRWQAHSTAGAAILDVLSITPTRVRWGTPFNGFCDSAYRLRTLPDGQGTYPDDLTPPAAPGGPTYRVVRLTLVPRPCRTGDAELQLALPQDGSRRAFVSSYGRDGRLTGWFGELTAIVEP